LIDVVSVFLLFVVFIHHKECETLPKKMSHTRLASELAIRGGRAAALQNMNLHDSRDKRAVVLQKVVIQKLHGLHQGNRS